MGPRHAFSAFHGFSAFRDACMAFMCPRKACKLAAWDCDVTRFQQPASMQLLRQGGCKQAGIGCAAAADNVWYSHRSGGGAHHPNPDAPQCLPCAYPAERLNRLPAPRRARACPCTPEAICAADDSGTLPRPPQPCGFPRCLLRCVGMGLTARVLQRGDHCSSCVVACVYLGDSHMRCVHPRLLRFWDLPSSKGLGSLFACPVTFSRDWNRHVLQAIEEHLRGSCEALQDTQPDFLGARWRGRAAEHRRVPATALRRHARVRAASVQLRRRLHVHRVPLEGDELQSQVVFEKMPAQIRGGQVARTVIWRIQCCMAGSWLPPGWLLLKCAVCHLKVAINGHLHCDHCL